MTATEIISQARHLKHKRIILKLDFEKVFDNAAWPFLLELLQARGFGDKWCNWIKDIVTATKSSLLINGSQGNYFNHRRGLRQGDLLSSQLFILVADILNRIFRLAASNYMIRGIGDNGIIS